MGARLCARRGDLIACERVRLEMADSHACRFSKACDGQRDPMNMWLDLVIQMID
ncbi:hypothetical protein PPL19_20641 [Pseudomonas psychrotolerans L19]|nr:hypothetical protein PPL19_20641 [Pseudomonas psychrotolerans L19]